LASVKAVPIATQQSHSAIHESKDRVVLEVDKSIYATHRHHRLEDRDRFQRNQQIVFNMSTSSKPEDDEALTRFNIKADRKMFLKLDMLLVPMCCAM
jgi:hypothetical protein